MIFHNLRSLDLVYNLIQIWKLHNLPKLLIQKPHYLAIYYRDLFDEILQLFLSNYLDFFQDNIEILEF